MSGVEAAASLFGSEDSDSDLFATLGAVTVSPQPPADDFFSQTPSAATEIEAFNFSSHSDIYPPHEPALLEEYHIHSRDTPTVAEDTLPYDQYVNGSNKLRQWDEHGPTALGEGHSTLTAQAVGASTNGNHNDYAPSVYSGDVDTLSKYNAYSQPAQTSMPAATYSKYSASDVTARTTAYSTYGAYDPPAPVSTSTRPNYGAYLPSAPVPASYGTYDHHPPTTVAATQTAYGGYEPPSTSYYKSESSGNHLPNLPYVPSQTATASQYIKPVSPPTATPAKATLTRPKVSNAYDPPFPVTSTTRHGSRLGLSHQIQARYQNPPHNEVSRAYSSPPYQPLTAGHDESEHHFADALPNGHYTMEPAHPSNSDHRYTRDEHTRAAPTHSNFSGHNANHSAEKKQVFLPNDVPDEIHSGEWAVNNAQMGIPMHDSHIPDSHVPTKPSSNPSPSSADISYASHASYTLTGVASPSLIPLPHSPPLEDVQDAEDGPTDSCVQPPLSQTSYAPQSGAKKDTAGSKDIYDPYAPKIHSYIPRTSSPLSVYNGRPNDLKTAVVGASSNSHINNGGSSGYGSVPRPLVGMLGPGSLHPPTDDHTPRQPSGQGEGKLGGQEILVKAASTQYAPSPSLLGANDPLSRTSARAPVITFGFGGKMITCFHGMPGLNAGFDVAFSSRTSSELKIRSLHKILPESTFDTSFPGPLLSDPGTASISLVRQNAATQMKTKKAAVLTYLSGRVSEIHQGLGYLSNAEKQTAENKLILVKLLSIMVDNDGRLLGTPQSEAAVRSTLVPRLEGAPVLQDAVSLQASYVNASLDEMPISVTPLRPATLDKIEELLLQGDRRQAYQFAMNEKLWAHAMVIASSIDKDSWKEVVHDFLRAELGVKEDLTPNLSKSSPSQIMSQQNTRESLRVAYSLFSGSGAAAVQELVPQNLLHRGLGGRLQPPMLPAATPRTPNFMPVQPPNILPGIPADALVKWAETAAMIISSPLTPESSAALTALGDQLLAHNFVEAAHSCYLLSPQTSLVGGLGSPTARITLIGSRNSANAAKDMDAVIFSEILEFALSLVHPIKGQEPFHGISFLQVYRFVRAIELAEHGDLQLANRYCEAITACLNHSPTYTNIVLLEQLQGLQQRLSGVFHGEKGGSWIGGKLSKPSLDSIGGWLEGRFTKLVTGDSESETAAVDSSKTSDQPFVGPFAHYSTISSTTPSARSSPQPQSAGLNVPPPQRTSSAMATTTPYSQQYQVERSSSAMGYMRQRPGVQTSASSSTSLASSQSSPVGYGLNLHSRDHIHNGTNSQHPHAGEEIETPVQGSSWWRDHENNDSNSTPTNATFMKVDESSITASSDGFISLMDSHSFSVGPGHQQSSSTPHNYDEDEEDDLGFGNSKPKPVKEVVTGDTTSSPPKAAPPVAEKTEAPPAASGSWLGRWWKRSDSATPAPIKASLGEESAFYYDKEQKRWVNRKAGAEEAPKPAAPPPPPSRAQTASPGMTGAKPTPHVGSPPLRSASAVDLSEPPMKAPMRIRSNLAPPTESAPSTPTGTRMTPSGPPPPSRPRSQAAKRNIRSRYVDVLQQDGTSQ